jgi:hypothetical protein
LKLQILPTDVEPTDVTCRRQLNAKNISTEDSSMFSMMTTESMPTDAAYKTSDEPTEVTPKKTMKMQEEEEEINKAGKDDATSAELGKNMSEIHMGQRLQMQLEDLPETPDQGWKDIQLIGGG